MSKRAIGHMYIHSREELDEFVGAVEDATKLFDKAEALCMERIQVHLEALSLGDHMFKIELSGESIGYSNRKEDEEDDLLI